MDKTQYNEIEKRVLKTVIEKPDFARWALLCSLMSDGIYIASEIHDRDLPKRGWLHICARYLAIVPKRENRDKRLAPNEFFSKEINSYCDVFRPVVRSLRHYMETIYPNFNSQTGEWSRAGKEEKDDNPFPFFISDYLDEDEDDGIVTFSILFEPIPEDSGDILRWVPEFNKILARITDDYDAELELGDFAGNVDSDEIKEIVKYLDKRVCDEASKIGYADKDEGEEEKETQGTNNSHVIQITGCENVQVVNDNGCGVQFPDSVSKSDKKTWLYWAFSIVVTVIAGLITAYLQNIFGAGA